MSLYLVSFTIQVGVRFTTKCLENTQITGKYFPIEFEIRDDQPMDVKGKLYKLKVCS